MLVGWRVLPHCWRKPGGRGQRRTSRPRKGGKQRLPLPSNRAASCLEMIRPLELEGPLCSTGLMTMKLRWTLHRARRSLRTALPWGINQGEAKKSLSHKQGKSPSSGRGKFRHNRRRESLRGKRRESLSSRRIGPQSGSQNRGRLWRSRDLPRRARESIPRQRLGAQAGTAGSRN